MSFFCFDDYDFKRSLLLCGPTGTGKTHRAKELMMKYLDGLATKSKTDVYGISDAHFKQLVKSNNLSLRPPDSRSSDITLYPLEMMLRCQLMIYDDLGVSDASEAYLRDLTYVLDERSKKGFVNIYTTNLTEGEMKKKMNERVVSRVLFNTDVVVFSGEDKRKATTRYFSG